MKIAVTWKMTGSSTDFHNPGLQDLAQLDKGFNNSWKDACCPEHSCFLADFALARLVALKGNDIFDHSTIHLLQRTLFLMK